METKLCNRGSDGVEGSKTPYGLLGRRPNKRHRIKMSELFVIMPYKIGVPVRQVLNSHCLTGTKSI